MNDMLLERLREMFTSRDPAVVVQGEERLAGLIQPLPEAEANQLLHDFIIARGAPEALQESLTPLCQQHGVALEL